MKQTMINRGILFRIIGIVVAMSFALFLLFLLFFGIYGHSWNEVDQLVMGGHTWRLRQLVRSNPQLVMERDGSGATPLHWVTVIPKQKQREIFEILLKHGADPNAIDKNGDTPLHWAVFNNQLMMVELLLKAGADPNLENSFNTTPIHYVLNGGNSKISDLLRQAMEEDGSTIPGDGQNP